MSLLLDERRQAMLLEMGIRCFGLEPALPAVGEVLRPVAQPLAQPTSLAAAAPGVELMQWDALAQAVSEFSAATRSHVITGSRQSRSYKYINRYSDGFSPPSSMPAAICE